MTRKASAAVDSAVSTADAAMNQPKPLPWPGCTAGPPPGPPVARYAGAPLGKALTVQCRAWPDTSFQPVIVPPSATPVISSAIDHTAMSGHTSPFQGNHRVAISCG